MLELPGIVEDVLGKVLPHATVEEGSVAVDTFTLPEVAAIDDRESDEAIYAQIRPIIINVHGYEDALAILKEIPGDTSAITTVGTFVISDAMLARIQAELAELDAQGSNTGFVLLDLETGAGLVYNIDRVHYSASSIKAINVCAFCYFEPRSWGESGGLMRQALVDSSNEAYEEMFNNYDENTPNRWRWRAGLGNQQTGRMYTDYSTRDFARLWCLNWDYLTGDAAAAPVLRGWMEATYDSAFAAVLGGRAGYTVCSKAGWEFGELRACNEGGYVVTPGGTYLLCIMTDRGARPHEFLADLVSLLDQAYQEYAPQKARGGTPDFASE